MSTCTSGTTEMGRMAQKMVHPSGSAFGGSKSEDAGNWVQGGALISFGCTRALDRTGAGCWSDEFV